ncbi:glycosyl hydrolase [Changchengzhania lutea]|uniref:glycosyl hydrolase n=1 Tax=Changchengzhania lutea TaxID=2049305 RepID=UPI00115D4F4B|nr:glycosyl hydrolase [Changchengzhania lutea]
MSKIYSYFIIGLLVFSCNSKGVENTKYDSANSADLIANFIRPTDDNTLWCYWYWIGDDISKEGITKDLEAMKEAGIGGALIGNINPAEKDGKVPMLSEEWWEHMVHAVEEGKRIGVDIGAFNCPGWSQSGGPWVKPDMAMRYLTYSEIKAEGGTKIELELVKPTDEFQDVYVLAFPSIASENSILSKNNSNIRITPSLAQKERLIDGDTTKSVGFSKKVKNYEVVFTSKDTIKTRSLKIIPGKNPVEILAKVYSWQLDDWKEIKSFKINRSRLNPNVGPDRYAPIMIALPESRSNQFKLEFELPDNLFKSFTEIDPVIDTWDIAEIIFSEAAGFELYADKNLSKMHPTPISNWDSYLWDAQESLTSKDLKVNTDQVIDISEFMDESGHLDWETPAGNWTIQRFGMTPTGTENAPAAPQGKGYEIDKANEELVKFHYEQFIGEFLKRIPEESTSAFKYVIADSYEMGSQNWTDGFEATFEKKYGYNPKKYLPVFTGRIVGSVEESERFLWDLRRAVADAVAYEYVGGLRKASNEDNLKLWLENYGHWGFPSEFLMYGGQSDIVSGEFWNEGSLGDIECKSASSAAHIYGKNRISAESFTASGRTYVRHPAMLKKRGDWAFTEGINHIVLHLYIHQPDDNRVPGVNAWFSTEFNRHNIWFKKSKAYFDYLRRCQHLLQQGTYAADVCYFIGENTPIMTGARQPELPDGYSYDYINAEVILNRLSIKDGKFVLPDGMGYSLMVLPPFETMRPELLSKIEELVLQGGKIYGQAPKKSPSLQNFPENDKKVKELADKMWGQDDSQLKGYGSGKIIDGLTLGQALDTLKIRKDVILKPEDPVLWTHRSLLDKDIYFLTNQSETEIKINPSFRVKNKTPELWDAVTGEIRSLTEYTKEEGRITVPLTMEAHQSWFVVFSDSEVNDEVKESGIASNFPEPKTVLNLDGPWEVDFKDKEIGPNEAVSFPKLTDWIDNENDQIKYYSGTAVYSSTFTYDEKDQYSKVILDLGKVGVMASVKINGKELGTTWMAPFQLNASEAIKTGENTIDIEVVNVWRNRITGDSLLPENERSTWLLVDIVTPKEELIPSGLMGPVTLKVIQY